MLLVALSTTFMKQFIQLKFSYESQRNSEANLIIEIDAVSQ